MLIYRSLIAFIVLAVAYSVLLPYTEINGFRRGSQWELNVMTAETFAYQKPKTSVVVTGSSISYWLNDLPDDWYNLAMAGEGALTGLSIIDQSDLQPHTVLVEINVIDRPVNADLLTGLYGPGIRQAKQHLPMLQEANEPSHVTLRCMHLADYYATRIAERLGYDQPDPSQSSEPSTTPIRETAKLESGGNILRAIRLEAVKTGYDESLLTTRLHTLRSLIEKLEARNIRVVLFEAPEDAATYDSPRRNQLRQLTHQVLPADSFTYLDTPLDQTYQTRDGVHMTAESAARYCHWLVNNLPTPNTLVSASP